MAGGKARLPPRWFIVIFWHVHRRIVQATRGRKGLWRPRAEKWGALRLTTKGRRSGEPRSVVLGYYEVLGRAAVGSEREQLWQRWRELDKDLESYAARRPHETAVVVLEPRPAVA